VRADESGEGETEDKARKRCLSSDALEHHYTECSVKERGRSEDTGRSIE